MATRDMSVEPLPERAATPVLITRRNHTYLRWFLPFAWALAVLAFLPLWPALLLAVWSAIVAQPLHAWLVRRVNRRSGAAAALTVLLVLAVLAPIVILGLSLLSSAIQLLESLRGSAGARGALDALLAAEPALSRGDLGVQQVVEVVRRHGGSAANAARTIFGATASAAIGLLVFVFGFYACLVDGRRAHAWFLEHSPLSRAHTMRLVAAFVETGRGLLLGVGLTALFQGTLATIGYVLIGVPQALVLGLVTVFAALVPSVGTGLVWVPVAIALFVADRMSAGIAMLVVGSVISIADNFVRPVLSRYAHLNLPTFVLFAAMLGGIAMFGPWGLLAGPLFVRLAVEASSIWKDQRELDSRPTSSLILDSAEDTRPANM